MKSAALVVLLFIAVTANAGLLNTPVLSASAVATPPGLKPGDPYRIVFVTSTTGDALSSNIDVYNAFVNNAANGASSVLEALGATWSVIGSTSAVWAVDNIGGPSPVPIFLLDGTLVASGTGDLWDGTIVNPIRLTETGEQLITSVWTGTQDDGKAYGNEPPFNSHYLGSIDPGIGTGLVSDYRWIGYTRADPNGFRSFYGISSTLRIPYNICLLYDPTKAVKSGTNVGIKLMLCDAAGNDLSSPSITLTATGITKVSNSISGAISIQSSGDIFADFNATVPTFNFKFTKGLGTSGGYSYTLSTKGLTTGSYNLNFLVAGDSVLYAAPFQVK
jgi:hypothetical protein